MKYTIADATEIMCERYCRYPEAALSMFKDPSDAERFLEKTKCFDCPIRNLETEE